MMGSQLHARPSSAHRAANADDTEEHVPSTAALANCTAGSPLSQGWALMDAARTSTLEWRIVAGPMIAATSPHSLERTPWMLTASVQRTHSDPGTELDRERRRWEPALRPFASLLELLAAFD
jgi:hypothetical protein